MWLYQHHTCSDVIDLSTETGHWAPVDDDKRPRVSALGVAYRDNHPIRGSYIVQDEKRYCMYWTEDKRFVFRTPEPRFFELCKKQANGTIVQPGPQLHCVITPAKHRDGRLRKGLSDVRLVNADGQVLYELTYNSEYYLRLYSSDFTAASMVQDLSDWDFFVALKEAIESFSEQASSGSVSSPGAADESAIGVRDVSHELLLASSGEICQQSGVWAAVSDSRVTANVKRGEKLPQHAGHDVTWVWSRKH